MGKNRIGMVGCITGAAIISMLAYINEGGAQQACQDLVHNKCKLKWVEISTKSNDESRK